MSDGGLRALFRKNIPGDWQAIETGSTGRGIPDANYCHRGAEGWVEFKACKHWKFGIWPEQIAWLERRYRNGGRVFLAVRRADDELWLIHPMGARYASLKDVPENLVLGRWFDGPGKWDWKLIENFLFFYPLLVHSTTAS